MATRTDRYLEQVNEACSEYLKCLCTESLEEVVSDYNWDSLIKDKIDECKMSDVVWDHLSQHLDSSGIKGVIQQQVAKAVDAAVKESLRLHDPQKVLDTLATTAVATAIHEINWDGLAAKALDAMSAATVSVLVHDLRPQAVEMVQTELNSGVFAARIQNLVQLYMVRMALEITEPVDPVTWWGKLKGWWSR